MSDVHETLAEIQATTDAATEGPWQMDGPAYHFYGDGDGDFVNSSVITAGPERLAVATMAPPLIADVIAWEGSARRFESDAEFIAMARTAVPALLSAVEKVLELHHLADWDYDHTETRCASCFDVYPCPTVQTIQESLGGVNHD